LGFWSLKVHLAYFLFYVRFKSMISYSIRVGFPHVDGFYFKIAHDSIIDPDDVLKLQTLYYLY